MVLKNQLPLLVQFVNNSALLILFVTHCLLCITLFLDQMNES